MPSRINQLLIEQYKKTFRGVDAIVSVGYPKMDVVNTHALRNKLAAGGAKLMFMKNRLADLALKELGVAAGAKAMTSGQSAFAFGGEDPVALARVLVDFQKEHPELQLHGAMIDGAVVGPEGAKELAKSPTKPELQARISGQLTAPARALASAVLAPANQIAAQIKTLVENKEKEGGDAA